MRSLSTVVEMGQDGKVKRTNQVLTYKPWKVDGAMSKEERREEEEEEDLSLLLLVE